jgi:hypothetical protein
LGIAAGDTSGRRKARSLKSLSPLRHNLRSFVTRGRFVNLGENLDWINHQLGLDDYPIVRRPPPEHRVWLFDQ